MYWAWVGYSVTQHSSADAAMYLGIWILLKPMKLSLAAVILMLFSLIDSCTISGLKSELPQYLAASEDVSPATDKFQWWRGHANEFPSWSNV